MNSSWDRFLIYKNENCRLRLPRLIIDQIHDLRPFIPGAILDHGYNQISSEDFSLAVVRQRIRVEFVEDGHLVAPVEQPDYMCECKMNKDKKIVFDKAFHFRVTREDLVIAEGFYDGQ